MGGLTLQAAGRLVRYPSIQMVSASAVGAGKADILARCLRARQVLVLDGCPSHCARELLVRQGIIGARHLSLDALGCVKGSTQITDELLQRSVACALNMLGDEIAGGAAASKSRVLFLCQGNACCSQMAEGWARYLWKDRLDAVSAGLRAEPIHPLAVTVMKEAGVDLRGQKSKSLAEFYDLRVDLVIPLCDDIRMEQIALSTPARWLPQGFPNPLRGAGSPEAILEAFRRTRDAIGRFVLTLPGRLEQEIHPPPPKAESDAPPGCRA